MTRNTRKDAALDQPETKWFPLADPIEIGMSTEGHLTITWQMPFPDSVKDLLPERVQRSRLGIALPPEQVKILVKHLENVKVLGQTLSAPKPKQGGH